MIYKQSLNPLKRVNSILTKRWITKSNKNWKTSLNPLKRVNSILTAIRFEVWVPSEQKVSIPSNGSIQFLLNISREKTVANISGLNPLKRVNSILTLRAKLKKSIAGIQVSIPSNGSIQFLLGVGDGRRCGCLVSIPSNGSIQFLRRLPPPTLFFN